MAAQTVGERKRLISFSNKKHIKKIPHLNNLSDEVIEDCWYTPEEYDDIKATIKHLVNKMEAGEEAKAGQQTYRGLEFRTQDGAFERFEHKKDAYNAVLDEQDRQWNVNSDDPEKIAVLYIEVSAKCQEVASKRGKQDEREIEDYMLDARESLASIKIQ